MPKSKGEENKPETRSAPPKGFTGGATPKADARCPECGVVFGRRHLEGCKYA
jgi:hypothetical protein